VPQVSVSHLGFLRPELLPLTQRRRVPQNMAKSSRQSVGIWEGHGRPQAGSGVGIARRGGLPHTGGRGPAPPVLYRLARSQRHVLCMFANARRVGEPSSARDSPRNDEHRKRLPLGAQSAPCFVWFLSVGIRIVVVALAPATAPKTGADCAPIGRKVSPVFWHLMATNV
jgi:hypothetical protein